MKSVRFELWDTTAFTGEKYQCDTPGDQSGEWVPMEAVNALVDALRKIAIGSNGGDYSKNMGWLTETEMRRIAKAALKAVEEGEE